MTENSMLGSRLLYIDFLRGIAVLGLLTMNIISMGLLDVDALSGVIVASEPLLLTLQTLLLDGRFRSIFCLLFGIGLYLQYSRYQQLNLPAINILKSRLHWLFIFGLCHCVILWSGDILMVYALSGLVLIKYLENTPEQLLKRGCQYFVIGMVIQILVVAATLLIDSELFVIETDIVLLTYQDLLIENILVTFAYIVTFPVLFMFYLCGVMFIGIALFRNGTLQQGFTVFQLWVLATVTLVFSLIDIFLINTSIALYIAYTGVFSSVSRLSMALLFWHWVLKSKCYGYRSILVSSVRAVGRKALSFYILQTIVMTTLLRFIFPQWNIEFTLTNYYLLAVAFIPVQLFIAYVYDLFYSQGPLEYCWRSLVISK